MVDDILHGYLSQRPFVTRSWLAKAIETHLRDEQCRHVLLTADAGMGKSSFVAWLSTRHPVAPRYFIRLDSVSPYASGDSVHLLMSVGQQMAEFVPHTNGPIRIEVHQDARRVDRGGLAVGLKTGRLVPHPFRQTSVTVHQKASVNAGEQIGIVADEVVDSEWLLTPAQLQQLALFEPARRLAQQDPRAQVVLLIDGLDELRVQGHGRGQSILDWLTDCPQLPPNVRVVATCRPDHDLLRMYRLRQRPRLREVTIHPTHERVVADMREYGRQLTQDVALTNALAAHGVVLDNAVRVVTKKANGNFLYLVAWTRAVRHTATAGRQADIAALASHQYLPTDLEALHALLVGLLRDAAGLLWASTYRPVLGVLTIARGPLSREQIAIMAGTDQVDVALADMPQLTTVDNDRFGIFHRSVAEYLTAASTRVSAPEHWIDPAMTNREAAAALIATFGADWAGCTDEYALANVVDHLVEALRQGADEREWCVRALAEVLADAGFARQKATFVAPMQILVDYGEAYLAMRPHVLADELPRLLAAQVIGVVDADTVHAGLSYRRDFDEFYGHVLGYLGDLDFVTEHAANGDAADVQAASIWADFAEILAGRHRRNMQFDAATQLLSQVAGIRGDQSRKLYEAGYLHFLHGRVDQALEYLTESVQAAQDAGRDVGRWISLLVHDQIAFFADRTDPDAYAATLAQGLEFFTGEVRNGAAHGPRWVMNVHNNMLTFACLRGDGPAARREWEVLSEDEWTLRERPEYLPLWEARAALAQRNYQRAADLYAQLLGPDVLHAPLPEDEGIAWRLLDYGSALAGIGRRDDAVLAWRQVERCADTTAAWPWKPRARALLRSWLGE